MFSLFNRTNNIEKIKNLGVGKVSNKEIVNSIISLEDAEKYLEKEDYKRVYDLYKKYNYQSIRVSMDLENLYLKAGSILFEFDGISKIDSYTKNETIFSSKSQKEKYMKKSGLLSCLEICKKTEIEAKKYLKGISEEKIMELYKNNLITEEEKNKSINAIQLLQFNLDFCPSQIKYYEEELKKLEND